MHLTHLECPRCGAEHPADKLQNLCACGSPLLARYDLAAVAAAVTPEQFGLRPADLWRYRELLPVADARFVTTLGEGWTPLLRAPAYGAEIGIPDLIVKDEGLTPTGSFKARGRGGRREPGPGAGRRADRHADQRQRGGGLGDVRGAGRDGRDHRHAAGRADHLPTGVPGRRGGPAAGRRADQRRRPVGRRAGRRVGRRGSSTPARCASRTAWRARRPWGTRSSSSSAGRCPM